MKKNLLPLLFIFLVGPVYSSDFYSKFENKSEETTLGKVKTETRMATPCAYSRKNSKAIMLEIEQEISKHSKDSGGPI